jgi:methionyl-tRNA synthetase
MPFTSKRILKMLNIHEPLLLQNLYQTLKEGHQLGEAILLFSKIEDDVIQKQIDKLQASKKVGNSNTNIENTALKTEITYDDFIKMDIRIGTILEAERVPKTDKLLKLLIDTGIDKRTVVSGIAEYYKPEEIIGQKVSVLANLAPRKIKGIESKGMILMAENADGTLSFVAPTRSDINNGSIVR